VLGVVGIVLGIVDPASLFVLAFILGTLAIVFGGIGLRKVIKQPEVGRRKLTIWAIALRNSTPARALGNGDPQGAETERQQRA